MSGLVDDMLAAYQPMILGLTGSGALTLRRPARAIDVDAAAVTLSLVLSGAHSLGATALTLALADGGRFSGSLASGAVLTIDGNDYALTADATATSNAIAATVTPGLAADQSDGTVATLAGSFSFSFASAQTWEATAYNLPVERLEDTFYICRVAIASASILPAIGDVASTALNGTTISGTVMGLAPAIGGALDIYIGRQVRSGA